MFRKERSERTALISPDMRYVEAVAACGLHDMTKEDHIRSVMETLSDHYQDEFTEQMNLYSFTVRSSSAPLRTQTDTFLSPTVKMPYPSSSMTTGSGLLLSAS